jgi:hypothetical protein
MRKLKKVNKTIYEDAKIAGCGRSERCKQPSIKAIFVPAMWM